MFQLLDQMELEDSRAISEEAEALFSPATVERYAELTRTALELAGDEAGDDEITV